MVEDLTVDKLRTITQ